MPWQCTGDTCVSGYLSSRHLIYGAPLLILKVLHSTDLYSNFWSITMVHLIDRSSTAPLLRCIWNSALSLYISRNRLLVRSMVLLNTWRVVLQYTCMRRRISMRFSEGDVCFIIYTQSVSEILRDVVLYVTINL